MPEEINGHEYEFENALQRVEEPIVFEAYDA